MDLPTTSSQQKLFALQPGFTNLNHGSFGTVPLEILALQASFSRRAEAKPDAWFRTDYFEHVDSARKSVAALVNADVDDIVLLENASSAINGILRSVVDWQRGDKVLLLSTAYRMCVEVLEWLVNTAGIEVVVVEVKFPYSQTELLQSVEGALATLQAAQPRVALFSHISSMPTLIEPVEELARLVKQHAQNCVVIIDGAHVPGALQLDLGGGGDTNAAQAMRPQGHSGSGSHYDYDFYTGNLHKWCFTPKGCAFLWTRPGSAGFQRAGASGGVQPLVISSRADYSYTGRFAYTGTRDYTAWACIPASIEWVKRNFEGFENMSARNHALIVAASRRVAALWGTSLLVPDEDNVAVMADVVAPPLAQSEAQLQLIQQRMDLEHNIFFVYGKTNSNPAVWFVRLSAQVYLELIQFEAFASLFLDLLSSSITSSYSFS
jgi:isopenicillin-N epimerase